MNKKKYIQYTSDIHLEFWKKGFPVIEPVEKDNSYLVLAGDIGYPHQVNYKQFIEHHSKFFKHIIIVAGNHEYYSSKNKQYTIDDIEEKIKSICEEFKNVTFLQKSFIEIENTVFIGCTLWSEIKNFSIAERCMNDYSNIYIKNLNQNRDRTRTKFNEHTFGCKKIRIKKRRDILYPEHIFDTYKTHCSWLFEQISNMSLKDVVVITHHAPSLNLLNEINMYSGFYASDLDQKIINNPNIKFWIFGHTHFNIEKTIGNTKCVSNCKGYKGFNIEHYNPDKYIQID